MRPVLTAPSLDRAAGIADLRELARRRLPKACFDWLDGGAGSESTVRANVEAFQRLALRPRALVDVSHRDQSTTVAGSATTLPVLLAPAGLAGILRPGAELAAARAAAAEGTVYCVSAGSSASLEEIARAVDVPLWFQLFLWRDHALVSELAMRAERSGYEALVVTVDTPVSGRRERDIRNGFTVPFELRGLERTRLAVRRPGWTWRAWRNPPVGFANLAAADGEPTALAAAMDRLHDASATFGELERLRERWPGRLVVKGIMSAEDAARCVDCGADAIVVSNHGGRQLDGTLSTLAALPSVASAVDGRADVLLDGGVRHGTDVVKAVGLGAAAVLVGRPYLYGIAAAGEQGARRALAILREEIDVALAVIGCPHLRDVDESVLASSSGTGDGVLHPFRIHSSFPPAEEVTDT